MPRYQIRAYDQRLNATAISDVWQFDAQAAVARIGEKNFSTLGEALSSAKENDTIVLLSDIAEENLNADKSVTLTTDGAAVYLIKIGDGNIFNISEGVTLTVKGSQSAPIIFEGNSVARGGRAFSSAGSLELEYVTFQNLNGTSADGTAINLWGEGNTLSMQNCTFSNVAGNGRGGAVYVAGNSTISVNIEKCTFSGCSIDGNSSNSTAGAVYLPGDKIVFDGRNYTFVAAYTSAETPGGDDGNSGNEGSTDNEGNTDNEGGYGNEGGTDNDGDNTPSTPAENGSLIAKIVIAVAVVLVAAAIIMVIIFVHKSRKNKRR